MKLIVLSLLVVGIASFGTFVKPEADKDCRAAFGAVDDFKVVVAIEPDWAPYSTCPANAGDGTTWKADCTGAVQEIYQAVCEANKMECHHVVTPWSNVWSNDLPGAGFANGDFLLAAGARNTFDRQAECMIFSNPYTPAGMGVLIGMEGASMPTGDQDEETHLCAISGWAIGAPWLQATAGSFANVFIHTFDSLALLESAIYAGECHVGLVEQVDADRITSLTHLSTIEGAAGGVGFMGHADNKKAHCAIEGMNLGLEMIRKNGNLASIMKKHGLEHEDSYNFDNKAHMEANMCHAGK